MKWICLQCRARFFAPGNRGAECPECRSPNCLDCNVGHGEDDATPLRDSPRELVDTMPPALEGEGVPGRVYRAEKPRVHPSPGLSRLIYFLTGKGGPR